MKTFAKVWRFLAIIPPLLTCSLELRSYILSPVSGFFPGYPLVIITAPSAIRFAHPIALHR